MKCDLIKATSKKGSEYFRIVCEFENGYKINFFPNYDQSALLKLLDDTTFTYNYDLNVSPKGYEYYKFNFYFKDCDVVCFTNSDQTKVLKMMGY